MRSRTTSIGAKQTANYVHFRRQRSVARAPLFSLPSKFFHSAKFNARDTRIAAWVGGGAHSCARVSFPICNEMVSDSVNICIRHKTIHVSQSPSTCRFSVRRALMRKMDCSPYPIFPRMSRGEFRATARHRPRRLHTHMIQIHRGPYRAGVMV